MKEEKREVPLPGLRWYTETPERRFTPLKQRKGRGPRSRLEETPTKWSGGPQSGSERRWWESWR